MDENENPFREVLCNDDDPIDELELAPAKLNTNEFVNIDADIATNNLQPMTVEEKVNCLNNKTHPESDGTSIQTEENRTTVTPPTQEELDGALETLSKLSFLTDYVAMIQYCQNYQNRLLRIDFKPCENAQFIIILSSI